MAKRKRSELGQARGLLYSLARFLGDIQAVSKGPKATVKRVARRATGKAVGRTMRRLFK